MNKATKESLLLLGIGAISTGIERMDINITLGIVLVIAGIAIIGVRGYLK